MKVVTAVSPLQQGELYLLDGGFSTQLAKYKKVVGIKSYDIKSWPLVVGRELTMTRCGRPGAWWRTRRPW